MTNYWRTTVDLMTVLATNRKAAHAALRALRSGGSDVAEHVAHIYSWAGADDPTANAKGAKMLKIGADIGSHLEAIGNLFAKAEAELKAAADFVDEREAKRRAHASKYQV